MGRKKVFCQRKKKSRANNSKKLTFRESTTSSCPFLLNIKPSTLPNGWVFVDIPDNDISLCVCYIKYGNKKPILYQTVTVTSNSVINIDTLNRKIDLTQFHLLGIPSKINDCGTFIKTLKKISSFNICPGNPNFLNVLKSKNGNLVKW